MPGFGEREQRVRRAALSLDIRLEAGKVASGAECFAERETGIHCQQRIGSETAEIDRGAGAELKRAMAGGPILKRRYRKAVEVVVPGGNNLIQVDTKIGLAALDEGKDFKSNGFDCFDLYVWIAPGVPMQEC